MQVMQKRWTLEELLFWQEIVAERGEVSKQIGHSWVDGRWACEGGNKEGKKGKEGEATSRRDRARARSRSAS